MNTSPNPKFGFSDFGLRFQKISGIKQLMDDINPENGDGRKKIMLGGGNPAFIDETHRFFADRITEMAKSKEDYMKGIHSYSSPQGDQDFLRVFAKMLRKKFGLKVTEENIAVTCGSQSTFYMLFNAFAGQFGNKKKKILFPLSPEYIGYEDSMFVEDGFVSFEPEMEIFEKERKFKYRLNTDRLTIGKDIGAICVSRPTNPTGNVITDEELRFLNQVALENEIPLIIDNAYGTPYPDLLFKPTEFMWNENIILCMSLSKLGLPATRSGVVVANKNIIDLIASMTARLTLAPPSFGTSVVTPLIEDGSLDRLCKEVIKPFYSQSSLFASETLLQMLEGYDCYLHRNEGAFFLWLWMKDLPVSSLELYQRLKARGVIVIPGEYFFPGVRENIRHKSECIRISFATKRETVFEGLSIIADEIKALYEKSGR